MSRIYFFKLSNMNCRRWTFFKIQDIFRYLLTWYFISKPASKRRPRCLIKSGRTQTTDLIRWNGSCGSEGSVRLELNKIWSSFILLSWNLPNYLFNFIFNAMVFFLFIFLLWVCFFAFWWMKNEFDLDWLDWSWDALYIKLITHLYIIAQRIGN